MWIFRFMSKRRLLIISAPTVDDYSFHQQLQALNGQECPLGTVCFMFSELLWIYLQKWSNEQWYTKAYLLESMVSQRTFNFHWKKRLFYSGKRFFRLLKCSLGTQNGSYVELQLRKTLFGSKLHIILYIWQPNLKFNPYGQVFVILPCWRLWVLDRQLQEQWSFFHWMVRFWT